MVRYPGLHVVLSWRWLPGFFLGLFDQFAGQVNVIGIIGTEKAFYKYLKKEFVLNVTCSETLIHMNLAVKRSVLQELWDFLSLHAILLKVYTL